MADWAIASGPHEYLPHSGRAELGWWYWIERTGERRKVSVEVVALALVTAQANGFEEIVRSIETNGRSAVEAVLDRDDPPALLVVTTGGIREVQE